MIKIHAPDFNYDIYSGSNGPTGVDQDVPIRHDSTFQTSFKSNQYQLLLPLSDGPAPQHISLISLSINGHTWKKHDKNNNTIEYWYKIGNWKKTGVTKAKIPQKI